MTKILVIEDEESVRCNIIELLEAEDFDVIAAENGQLGVFRAKNEVPDLILCDVMMPQLDGYGVLTELREDPRSGTIPFIFLTAKSSRQDWRQGMQLGADDYLTKPFTREELPRGDRHEAEKIENHPTAVWERIADFTTAVRSLAEL